MRRSLMMTGAALVALALPTMAAAETLRDALARAYISNPTLNSARSGQRAQDETIPIARADALPSVGGTVGYSENLVQAGSNSVSPDRLLNTQAQLSVPLFAGGSVRNSIRSAEARVEAGQTQLRAVESNVFTQVVAAYMDVLRDEAVVALNRNQVDVLNVNLQAARDRFDIGDITRTDVAQSEARLALARAQLQGAEARLIASREAYVRQVGVAPDNLQPPPPLVGLPGSAADATEQAVANNPSLLAAQIDARAAGLDVRVAQGARLPRVGVTTNAGYVNYLGSINAPPGISVSNGGFTAGAGVQLSVPIFQAGRTAARIRQAQALEGRALEDVIGTERAVIAQARAAYASWQASNAVIQSSQVAVDATRLGLEGVRAENSVGTRTIIEILNAEQEFLNAQVQLVTARRDAYVAGFALLAAVGRAEADDLGIVDETTRYDPRDNAARVRNIIWDWGNDPAPITRSTSTRTVPAQDAVAPPTVGRATLQPVPPPPSQIPPRF